MRKKIILGIFAIIIGFLLYHHSLVRYLFFQATGQIKIVLDVVPVKELMAESSTPDTIKNKLKLIERIKAFAQDSIGLDKTKNYTTFYNQKGKPILWVVKACPPFSLDAYKWSFPIAGSFSYKGFFRQPDALTEKEKFINRGYDVRVGKVNGWSTLGILKDPVLSGMLERKTGELAELIIHELTHATLFVKDQLQFNENLASFVGVEGAKCFLKTMYGENSPEYEEYIQDSKDSKKFQKHFLQGANQLDSLYRSFPKKETFQSKNRSKDSLIHSIVQNSDTIKFWNKEGYSFLKNKNFKPNNAYFTVFRLYHDKEDTLRHVFYNTYNKDFKRFMQAMKAQYD